MNTELSYFAGFFDGEGCILMSKRKEGTLRIMIEVANTCAPILKRFQNHFGGKFYHCPSAEVRIPLYKWRLNAIDDCLSCLRQLSPLLIDKQAQAEIAIKWLERRAEIPSRWRNGNNKFAERSLELDADIATVKRMKRRLNHPNVAAIFCGNIHN
jgi:hypothetical protein